MWRASVEASHAIEFTTTEPQSGNTLLLVPAVWSWERLPERLRRFEVDPKSDCWLWQGPPNAGGHGQLRTPNGTTTAHRAVYEALIGPLGGAIDLHHICPNRLCVNPLHLHPKLESDHHSDHCREKWAEQKRNPEARLIGMPSGRNRLTDEQRAEIRDLYLSRWGTMQQIADRVGCSRQTVHTIIRAARAEDRP